MENRIYRILVRFPSNMEKELRKLSFIYTKSINHIIVQAVREFLTKHKGEHIEE